MPPRPIIFLIPGSFHDSACFDSLRAALDALAYSSVTATLPSIASHDPFTADAVADSKFIRANLESLIKEGQAVLLVAHSYGGIPGAAAATGLSMAERHERGDVGGVVGLVFISAVLTKEGESCLEKMGGVYPHYSAYNEKTGEAELVTDPVPTFFNDLKDDAAASALTSLKSQAGIIFATSSPRPAWVEPAFQGRCVYLRCTKDACIPAPVQDALIEASGINWRIKNLDTGHCPFFGVPDDLAQMLVSFAEEFDKA